MPIKKFKQYSGGASGGILPLCLFAIIVCFMIENGAHASISQSSHLFVKPGKMSVPIQGGVLFGGEAGAESSIIGIRQQSLANGIERMVISYGDRVGKPLTSKLGYFHAAIDRHAKRVVIDLAQVSRTAVDQKDLAKLLSKSTLIASSDMTMDPQDGSTNITLSLRQPATLSMQYDVSGGAQIVVELKRIP